MAINETKQPYELLIRWNNGVITGAHVKYKTILDRDGVVFQETEGPALPVGTEEYPLSDILTQMQIDALVSIDSLTAELTQAKTDADAKQTALDQAQRATDIKSF